MTNEGRRDPRKPTVLQIRFKNATIAEFLEKHSRDISKGGIFIKMKTPFPSGTLIKFDIRIAEDSVIHGVGRVVWCRRQDESPSAPCGMGVKFIKLDDKSRILLDEVLAGKGPKEVADTPLFDDALPKPKAKIPGLPDSSKPALPSPSGKKSSKGVSLEEDTRKVRLASIKTTPPPPPPSHGNEEAETVVSDGAIMEEVLRMARQSSDELPPSPDGDPLLSGSKEKFVEDISSAISDALQDSTKQKAPPAAPGKRTSAPKPSPLEAAPDKYALPRHPAAKGSRNNTGLLIAIGIAALVGGFLFFMLFLKSRPDSSKEVVDAVRPAPVKSGGPSAAEETVRPKKNIEEESPATKAPEEAPPEKTRTLKVETFPKDATVSIDGAVQPGKTPIKLTTVPAEKPVEITIHRFGYLDITETLAPEESEAYIKRDLKPAGYTIDITSEPAGAKIVIDQSVYGVTPRRLKPNRFSPTSEIRLVKPGFATAIYSIQESDWRFDGKKYQLTIEAALEAGSTPTHVRKKVSSHLKSSTTSSATAAQNKDTAASGESTNAPEATPQNAPGAAGTESGAAEAKAEGSPGEQPSAKTTPESEDVPAGDVNHTPDPKPETEAPPSEEAPTADEKPASETKPSSDDNPSAAPKEKAPSEDVPTQPEVPKDTPKTGQIDENPF